ncbi:osmoprotectant transport system ATP-binding protein [Micromonospora kangleipakensis]|uniref:ABC-type quaternary amine transporter n=1 Tax=Micromonospora kangleipakensis TaxID=1077942 RepID=A0A4Q8B481_9ACTN|nr:ATP-binding cassette domain-containing protein [Micromonospora kangleipakensis]RZU72088.1 osmoprotectant transport system ATP-binding protein [Micromonospora kangleipakensis]
MDVTPGTTGDAGHGAASITLEGIRKRYPDGTEAVRKLSLEVKAGELAVLIGPSGCGKSTVLRMINRLIEPTDGRILLGDDDVTRVDPVKLRRRIGYVIQNVGLFPHQTVSANVATVPALLGWPRERTRRRVDELLDLVGLDPAQFGRRYPHELSGGQRQRVGVARALAADPVVLLMDEPFSAVDPIVRTRLQEEFLRLQAEVRKTIVLVTHDLDEAVRLGDRIAVLSEGGRLEQYDTPAAILGSPASPFVREFVGADRGIRRLAVTPVTRAVLDPLPVGGGADLPAVPLGGSAYDALGVLLTSAAEHALVTEDGHPVGLLSRDRVLGLGAVAS